ncbi:hypothetical protein LCGC14_2521050, partial [marine sediment metagenome]
MVGGKKLSEEKELLNIEEKAKKLKVRNGKKLSQADVIEFLQRNPNWFKTKEIAKELNLTGGTISRALKILRTTNMMQYRTYKIGSGGWG